MRMWRDTRRVLVVVLELSLASGAGAYTGTYTPGSGINGTVHDLGTAHNAMAYTAAPTDNLQRVCIYCHAPHNAANGGPEAGVGGASQVPQAFDYLPLWNHELTGNYARYAMYQSATGAPQAGARASQAIANGMTPGANSLLCLGCHDGSVAVNSYGNGSHLTRSQSGGGGTIGAQYVIGKDNHLGNHHPIGFDYDAVQSGDSDIRPADTASLGGAGTVRDHLYGPGSTRMECGSCHAVHNKGNTGEKLLWRSDVRSQLCLTCHDTGTNPGLATP